MTVRLTTGDGKTVIVSDEDVCLYSTRTNNSTRWTEYMVHRARSGKLYFYIARITMWQGESDSYELVSKNEMIQELSNYSNFDAQDVEDISKYIPEFFTENA